MDDVVIKVDNVSKTFKLPHEKHTSIKSSVINFYRKRKGYEMQKALKGVSFEVKKGEFFGIVGRNGSGKSTLLKMLAGIYLPTSGKITVDGAIVPFIELGVGFNPELTGRENVYLNGALLGFSRDEINLMYQDIVDFAELENFMDQKLKNYSSGMQVRLAFSIAIRARGGILLLDEVLAVGDAIFQQKCFDYFKELKRNKRTVVFVSHDVNALQQYCDKGILIDDGVIITEGPIQDVVHEYQDRLAAAEESMEKVRKTTGKERRWGSHEVKVASVKLSAGGGKEQAVFKDEDETIRVVVKYTAAADAESPIYGFTIFDRAGNQIFASNTFWLKIKADDLKKGDSVEAVWEVPNIFNNGSYLVNPAVANSTGTVMLDWRDGLGSFKIRKRLESTAQLNAPHTLELRTLKGRKN